MTTALEPTRSAPGRVPPHNLEAEESLLGAMMLSRVAISAADEARVTVADFYKPAHGHIFTAISALAANGEPVDPVTVADELARVDLLDGLGGRQTLLKIQGSTPASVNAAHYAKIVTELSLLRSLIGVAGEIAEMGYDDSEEVDATLDRAESAVFALTERRVVDSVVRIGDAHQEALDAMDLPPRGVPTGYGDLDRILLGLQPSGLYVVAARPAMGKSAFVLGGAAHIAATVGRPALLFSMEMSTREIVQRLWASGARVDLRAIQRATLEDGEWSRLQVVIGKTSNAPLYIDDNPHCTVGEMRAKARRIRAKHGDLALIAVDYLQLMTPASRGKASAENREVEVAEMSRGLKLLARELDCPVMALAQLNRQLEYRADKRPMLADLRNSGALEQDADVVIFIYRDEVYHPGSDQAGTAEIIVSKHRNGPTGTVRLSFVDRFTKFSDLAKERA